MRGCRLLGEVWLNHPHCQRLVLKTAAVLAVSAVAAAGGRQAAVEGRYNRRVLASLPLPRLLLLLAVGRVAGLPVDGNRLTQR